MKKLRIDKKLRLCYYVTATKRANPEPHVAVANTRVAKISDLSILGSFLTITSPMV